MKKEIGEKWDDWLIVERGFGFLDDRTQNFAHGYQQARFHLLLVAANLGQIRASLVLRFPRMLEAQH